VNEGVHLYGTDPDVQG